MKLGLTTTSRSVPPPAPASPASTDAVHSQEAAPLGRREAARDSSCDHTLHPADADIAVTNEDSPRSEPSLEQDGVLAPPSAVRPKAPARTSRPFLFSKSSPKTQPHADEEARTADTARRGRPPK
ncbi:MAG TPA: hypothetical protein VM925_28285 [Labilithrix sp.]|nr:hypothetical protein [Labilithrix sp.]